MALTLHYDFTSPSLAAEVGPTLGITRTTDGTMVDADGNIVTRYAGEPRFPGATYRNNILIESTPIDGGGFWNFAENVTGVSDADSINGVSLTEVTDDAVNGEHSLRLINQLPYSVANAEMRHIFSAYVKAGTEDYILFQCSNSNLTGSVFNASTGLWHLESTSYDDHGVLAVDGGYRVWFTIPSDVGGGSGADDFLVGFTDDGTPSSYSGTGTTFYVGGLMLETDPTDSRTTPSELIETTGSFASRLSGTSEGLLVEEARTNSMTNSEFQSAWTEGVNAVTVDKTTATQAPNGSYTAREITGDGTVTTSGQVLMNRSSINVVNLTQYAISCFIKSDTTDTHQYVTISHGNHGTLNYAQCFDVINGTVGAEGDSVDDAGIEDYGNGWYRCWYVVTGADADQTGNVRIMLQDANEVTINSSNPSTAGTVYLWGYQQELGAFPTSYIPTDISSVTRNADDIDGTELSWFNNEEGSMYAKGTPDAGDPNWCVAFGIDSGSTANTTYVGRNNANRAAASFVTAAGDNAVCTPTTTYPTETEITTAFGYAVDDCIAYNHDQVSAGDSGFDPPVAAMTRFSVGHRPDSLALIYNGTIKEVRYYDTRLTDEELEAMSNGTFPGSGPYDGYTDEEYQLFRRKRARLVQRYRRR